MPAERSPGEGREHRMRELLGEHAKSAPSLGEGLQADAVIAKARRRRRPRQLAVGGASALAVVGLLTVAIPFVTDGGIFGDGPMQATTLAESDMNQREEDATGLQAPEATSMGDFACTDASASHAVDGFALTVNAHSIAGTSQGWVISADIAIENTGTTAATIDVDAVSVFLDQDGSTVGAYFGGLENDPVTLEPGERSIRSLEIKPAPCDPGHTLAGEFSLRVAVYLDGELAVSEPVTVTAP